MSLRRRELAAAGLVALLFGTAPTVGDIGSCGQVASDLDPQAFGQARKQVDCQRCSACALTTQTCQSACDPNAPGQTAWPATCHPLVHDGDVCLRALEAASCSDYSRYVDDQAPTVPTECDFCHFVPQNSAGTE